MKNASPLRYPGGKTRACKILDDILQKHFEIEKIDEIISPFFGGGSFEFYLQNKYEISIVANDKFTPLYHFWRQIKEDKHTLVENLKKSMPVSKEVFIDCRKKIRDALMDASIENATNIAAYYFILNRCSFSGSTLSGGFSKEASEKRFTYSSIAKIEALNLSNIDFYNEDFETFILKTCTTSKALLFLDPPYYLLNINKLYGINGDMHENFDHIRLFEVLKKKDNWIITYNRCDYIIDLYKDYIILDVQWSYGMNATKKSSEIVILSKKQLLN
jgi:DNA adenine methylase